jgi:hypothetical protein
MVQSVGFGDAFFVSDTSAIAAAVSSCAIAKPASQYFTATPHPKSSWSTIAPPIA